MRLPIVSKTITGKFAGVMAGSNREIATIEPDVIEPMRDGDPLRERAKIMILYMDAFLRIEGPFPKKLTDQFFFLVSMLKYGFPVC